MKTLQKKKAQDLLVQQELFPEEFDVKNQTSRKGKEVYRLTHARHDPAHCLIPGLFRSLPKGERKRGKLELVYELSENVRIEAKLFEPLGADDLRVLQGLVAMAAVSHEGKGVLVLNSQPQTPMGIELRELLDFRYDATTAEACVVCCSYYELAKEIGYSNPKDTKRIRDCIERLFLVTFFVQEGQKRYGFRLLSRCASDQSGVVVALNPLIASAVMGGRHVRIDMDEVRALKTDAARLIHQRLCAWINPGASSKIERNKLISYVWPYPASPAAQRKRRVIIKRAIKELGTLPAWKIQEYLPAKYKISRLPTQKSPI